MLFNSLPNTKKELQSQTEVSDLTEEEIEKIKMPVTFSVLQRIVQIICFIFFIGPLRLVLFVVALLFVSIVILILTFFCQSISHSFNLDSKSILYFF